MKCYPFVLCAVLIGFVSQVQSAQFVLTDERYNETEDLDAIVQQEYGSKAEVANWEEIKTEFSGKIANFLDKLGIENGDKAILYQNGEGWWSGNRHYFMARHNGIVPGGWLAHDHIDDHTVDLGSWYNLNSPILVKINDSPQQCPADPADCGITIDSLGGFTQAELNAAKNSAEENSKQACRDNPASCGISVFIGLTQDDLNQAEENGKQACKDNPASCGIDTNVVVPATLNIDLSLHVDKMQYKTLTGTSILWVDLIFGGQNEQGDLIWILEDYGEVE